MSLLLGTNALRAQNEDEFEKARQQMMKEFLEFDQQSKETYTSFRSQCNHQYADFMRQGWKWFESEEPLKNPLDDIPVVPPVVAPIEDQKPPVEDTPAPAPVVVPAPVPEPVPEPHPVEPVPEPEPMPTVQYCEFSLFGTACKVRYDFTPKPHLKSVNNEHIAQMWETLADQTDEMLYDCLALRESLQLCDWAYMQLVAAVANTLYPNENESAILQNLLLVGSGFDVLMAIQENNQIHNLINSNSGLFQYTYFLINGKQYYWLERNPKQVKMQIMQGQYPESSPMSMSVTQENLFSSRITPQRTFQSQRYPNMEVTVRTNKNQIDFYNTYPAACEKNNPYTKWRFYAETPLCIETRNSLYPSLRQKIAGKSQKEAAEMLLNWVQTSLVYEYDDKVWGEDRAFFGEETLYYPYADCEDRSILFSHLMRDLLNLDVVLIYYPGHLATAVRYTDPNVHGDYILYNGQRYYISDPTYIGACIGRTMPNMNNAEAVAIPVRKIQY